MILGHALLLHHQGMYVGNAQMYTKHPLSMPCSHAAGRAGNTSLAPPTPDVVNLTHFTSWTGLLLCTTVVTAPKGTMHTSKKPLYGRAQ
jgi:hypothetical protein